MFTKHVWHDRHHQAEVFISEEGEVSGTIVTFKGAVSLINPRPEILGALYQEAKVKRILSIRTVILTNPAMEFTRGLCSLLGYFRGLRRRSTLEVITRADLNMSYDFLNSCCVRLLGGDSRFDVDITQLPIEQWYELGVGKVMYVRPEQGQSANPLVEIRTNECMLRYYDESHSTAGNGHGANEVERPHLVVRAAGMPEYSSRRIGSVIAGG